MKKLFLRLTLWIGALAAGACDLFPTAPEPGELTVSLATPASDDRALVLQITGPEAVIAVGVEANGYTVHSRTAGTTTRVAVFGNLASGPLLRISVADVNKVGSYTAKVTEAAGESNELRESLAGYSVSIAK